MIFVRSLTDCDNPDIPDRHQCLLRLKFQQLLDAYTDNDSQGYCSDTDGFIVYIESGDDANSALADLDMPFLSFDTLVFDDISFCHF